MPKSRDTAVGERLLDHVAQGTTDVLSDVRRIPASYYLDPELWDQEMRNIFKRLPLMLAFSTEIAEAGAYRAIDVVGVPVLIVRGPLVCLRKGRVSVSALCAPITRGRTTTRAA